MAPLGDVDDEQALQQRATARDAQSPDDAQQQAQQQHPSLRRSRGMSIAKQSRRAPSASDTARDQHPPGSTDETNRRQQPVSAAVNNAFDQSNAAASVDPALVAAITAQVIENLKVNGIGSAEQPATRRSSISQSGNLTSSTPSMPPRDVYTPPSPVRDDGKHLGSVCSDSFVDAGVAIREDGEALGKTADNGQPAPASPERRPRPAAARELTGDATTLEKIWQPFFSATGEPTARIGQFLRGLALYIIEDYEPTNSLVISPQKMLRFYSNFKLPNEIYPWSDIFGGTMTKSSISHLYRDLECQHYFIQSGLDDKPSIPSLTPAGFQSWMTHLIRAYPDLEFERFAKVALEMPIDNADDRRERFPKQLSRRLFPARPNAKIRENFEDSVLADPIIQLVRTPTPVAEESPVLPRARAYSQPPEHHPQTAPSEARVSFDLPPSAEDPVDSLPPAVTIERERKPYAAQPGGGRVLAESPTKTNSHRPRSHTVSSPARAEFDDYEHIGEPVSRRRSETGGGGGSVGASSSSSSSSKDVKHYTTSYYRPTTAAAAAAAANPHVIREPRSARPHARPRNAGPGESDDDAGHRVSRLQSRTQRARQHVLDSTSDAV